MRACSHGNKDIFAVCPFLRPHTIMAWLTLYTDYIRLMRVYSSPWSVLDELGATSASSARNDYGVLAASERTGKVAMQ